MVNKKDNTWIYGTIVGLIIFLFLILMVIITTERKSEFKITKEECRNESNDDFCWDIKEEFWDVLDKYDYLGCYILERYNVLNKSIECKLIYDIIKEEDKKIDECFINPPIEEICEQVEVDEMIFNYNQAIFPRYETETDETCRESWVNYKLVRCYDYFPNQILNKEVNCCLPLSVLSKKSFTIEWLDENTIYEEDCDCWKINEYTINKV